MILAIRAAMDAKKPTWKYAVAVLSRCLSEKVMTAETFRARTDAHRHKREVQKGTQQQPAGGYRVPAQEYTQREYTREELYALFEKI